MVAFVKPQPSYPMAIVRQILSEKGETIWKVKEATIVYDALQLMADQNIGSVLVMSEEDALVGIFSERDYARKVVLRGKRSAETQVHEVMSGSPQSITPDTRLETCMQMMTEHRFRHLPVVENEQLIGVISIGDIVKAIIRNQREVIQEMESYIQGQPGF